MAPVQPPASARGTVVDIFWSFEDELNKKLAAEKKLKNKNLKVRESGRPEGSRRQDQGWRQVKKRNG